MTTDTTKSDMETASMLTTGLKQDNPFNRTLGQLESVKKAIEQANEHRNALEKAGSFIIAAQELQEASLQSGRNFLESITRDNPLQSTLEKMDAYKSAMEQQTALLSGQLLTQAFEQDVTLAHALEKNSMVSQVLQQQLAALQADPPHNAFGKTMLQVSEDIMVELEERSSLLATGAVRKAYFQTLKSGSSVLEAINDKLVETGPDASQRVIKSLPPPYKVAPGAKRTRRGKK